MMRSARPRRKSRAARAGTVTSPIPPSRSGSSRGSQSTLVYDRHPRKALVDHFYPIDVTLEELAVCRDGERGDFAGGTYLARIQPRCASCRGRDGAAGRAGIHTIRDSQDDRVKAGSRDLVVSYVLEDLPPDEVLHFAVEINLAAMAGHADDRYFTDASGSKLGMLRRPGSICPILPA